MARENYANFATTTLATPSTLTSTALSFTVSSGQGALFPTTNFPIVMDTEIMLITSRSTDTFTVGTRGFDNSVAASHSAGATIQQCTSAYSFTHLWQNTADTFAPEVPPVQLGNTPSTYDHEFEVGGNALWQLYPSTGLPTGTTFSIGTPLKSHLLFNRGSSDNAMYTAYVPFTQSPPFTITFKLSHSANLGNSSSGAEVHFFVTDQTNPSGGADTGNRLRIDAIIETYTQSANWQGYPIITTNAARVRMLQDTSGVGAVLNTSLPVSAGVPLYLRLGCSASNVWTGYLGDGTTFWTMGSLTTTITPQSLGFNFYANPQATTNIGQTAAIDFVRVVPSVAATTFGS